MEGSFWEEGGVRASPSQVLVLCVRACGSWDTNGGLCFGTQLPSEAPWSWAGFTLEARSQPIGVQPLVRGQEGAGLAPQKADAAGWGQQSWLQMHFVSPLFEMWPGASHTFPCPLPTLLFVLCLS